MNLLSRLRGRMTAEHDNRIHPGMRDQWMIAFFSLWFIGGLFTDGWAHNHIPELESFFTPWHGIFYSGYLVLSLALLWLTWRNKRSLGVTWRQAIPVGYEYAVLGVGIFFFGGIGDLIWHSVFGIEADIEALLSPTHLILATGLTLMMSSNLVVWWHTASAVDDKPRLTDQLPMLLSLAFILSLFTFMTQFAHPIEPWAAVPRPGSMASTTQSLAVAGYLLQSTLMLGTILLMLRRAKPAMGAFTILLTLNILAMALMRDGVVYVLAGVASGIVADLLALHLYPLTDNRKALRIFAFAVPATFFTAYFVIMAFSSGIWWSIHMWAGSIVMAGFVGLLLSLVALPFEGERR